MQGQAQQPTDPDVGVEHGVVTVGQAFQPQQPEAVEVEDTLDQHRPGEQQPDEQPRQPREHQDHGVAEDVAVHDPAFAQPLGPRGGDVLLAEVVHEAVLGQHHQPGVAADQDHHGGQRHVPEIVADLLQPVQLAPVVGDQPLQREPLQLHGENGDQHDGQHEVGDGVDPDHARGRCPVKATAVAAGLGDPQRNTDQVGEQGPDDSQPHGHRHALDDDVEHGTAVAQRLLEIETQEADEVVAQPHVPGPVEAEHHRVALEGHGVHALAPAVALDLVKVAADLDLAAFFGGFAHVTRSPDHPIAQVR